ncbi:MAG: protein kinase [Acidobacteriia bacterium]|nr:protein kinase [Terriglobia bacterium]
MPLLPGSKLGRYEIVSAIGAGGMGEVYRARDLELGREVAIKILSERIGLDPDRLRRFQQEARITASTNHPNILAVYDVGTCEGTPFIVSELLEGMTLRDRLRTGPLPTRGAIEIAGQIASGLATAHEKGIIHRDLKPDNVFLTKDGQVKILDFGIAKLSAPDPGGDQPTLTTAGVIMGTLTYMSPEQVCGAAVDHRSDIFSLGGVLYEMLVGAPPFSSPSRTETVRAILNLDPLEEPAAEKIPAAVRRVLQHCMEKDAANRFQSARDLVFALQGTVGETSATVRVRVTPQPARRVGRRGVLEIAGALVLLAAAVFAVRRATIVQPQFDRLTYERGTIAAARFAPDEHNIIYSASWSGSPVEVYSTSPEFPSSRPLGLGDATVLGISRTGELALLRHGRLSAHLVVVFGTLARAPMAGGAPRDVAENVRWADWDPHGELAVVRHQGGPAGRSRLEYPIGKVLYETPGWISHIRFSPTGDRIAFLDHAIWSDDRGTVCVIDTSGKRTVLSSGWEAADGLAWSPSGEVWVSATRRGFSRSLYAISMSGHEREVLAVPTGMTLQDIASDGRVLLTSEDERSLMQGTDGSGPERDLSWFDWTIARDISPDGKLLLFEEAGAPAGEHYMAGLRKFDASPPLRLGEGSPGGLSRDGKWVVATTPTQVTLLPTGAGQPITVSVTGLENFGSARIFPDGEHLLLNAAEKGHAARAYIIDQHGSQPRAITPEGVPALVVSPDGRLVAAPDNEHLITVYAVDGSPSRRIPNLPTGFDPIGWSADPGALYVSEPASLPNNVYLVDIATGKRQLVRKMMPNDPAGLVNIGGAVITPDGKAYAYNYYRVLSTLYVVRNLK